MWKGLVWVWLFLLVVMPVFSADGVPVDPQQQVQAQIDSANRFLSAEVSRQMKASQEETIKQINAYNDENYQIFDQRMTELMTDIRLKVIIGGIGAILVANAILGLIMLHVNRRYSFEYYLQKEIGAHKDALNKQSVELEQYRNTSSATENRGFDAARQREWPFMGDPSNVSAAAGISQKQASDISQFNEWQHAPARQGSWVAPSQEQMPPQYPVPPPMPQPQYQVEENAMYDPNYYQRTGENNGVQGWRTQ